MNKPGAGSADAEGMKLKIEARSAGATISQRDPRTYSSIESSGLNGGTKSVPFQVKPTPA